jgi:hypothetical protein
VTCSRISIDSAKTRFVHCAASCGFTLIKRESLQPQQSRTMMKSKPLEFQIDLPVYQRFADGFGDCLFFTGVLRLCAVLWGVSPALERYASFARRLDTLKTWKDPEIAQLQHSGG